jgi:hypothetical protein
LFASQVSDLFLLEWIKKKWKRFVTAMHMMSSSQWAVDVAHVWFH